MFKNLEKMSVAMGFKGLSLEFLQQCKDAPGAFSRKAVMCGMSISEGIEAKKEFFKFMDMGAQMFAKA